MQEIDNFLFERFFGFIIRKFTEKYNGSKRFNWKPDTRRTKNRLFWLENMQMYFSESEYENNEPLLFKLVFSTYGTTKMLSHGFKHEQLNDDWKILE
jgi:hypothetical protein